MPVNHNPNMPDPENFTENGKCARCGGCCSSILPLSEGDMKRLKKFADKKGIVPKLPEGDDVIYLHCPFLADDIMMPGKKRCLCYEVRPAICKIFSCASTNKGNVSAWLDAYPDKAPPDAVNAWKIFNLTGLRVQGRNVPYAAAPRCRVETSDGGEYEFTVGRPVSFISDNGVTIPPSLVIAIDEKGIAIFNGATHRLEQVAFNRMSEILTESCIIKAPGKNTKTEEKTHGTE